MVTRLGNILPALFDEKQMQQADSSAAFFSCWQDLVIKNGIPAAAAHTRIQNLEKGLVRIEVDHPGWKQALQTKESKLLHDFRYRFPDLDISGIAFVLSKPEVRGKREEVKEKREEVKGKREEVRGEREGCDAGYEGITDPDLRDALMRLEREIIERERSLP